MPSRRLGKNYNALTLPTRKKRTITDLDDFIRFGESLLHGAYLPRYPLPMQGFFVVLALLPRPVDFALIVVLSILALLNIFKRRAPLWIAYAPILQGLVTGNLDVLALWLLVRASPVSLALLTLKPQLFLFALPVLIRRRELWRPFALWTMLLWGLPTLLYPQWIGQFIRGASDGRVEQGTSSSLWPVPLLALALIVFMLTVQRYPWRVIVSSLNPLLRAYDYTMIAGASLWLIPASWLCVWLMWQVYAAWPMALLGVVLLIPPLSRLHQPAEQVQRHEQRREQSPAN